MSRCTGGGSSSWSGGGSDGSRTSDGGSEGSVVLRVGGVRSRWVSWGGFGWRGFRDRSSRGFLGGG